jgi:hypothetical protein
VAFSPVPTANPKRLTATANRLILAPDERSLQIPTRVPETPPPDPSGGVLVFGRSIPFPDDADQGKGPAADGAQCLPSTQVFECGRSRFPSVSQDNFGARRNVPSIEKKITGARLAGTKSGSYCIPENHIRT